MCQHCIQNPRCIYIIHASRSFDPSLIIRLQVAYDASGSFHISLGRYISVHHNQVYVLVKADDGFGLANLTGASWVRHISGLRWGAVGLDLTVNWWRAMGGIKRKVSRRLFVTHFAHKNLPSGLSVFFIRKTRDYGLQLTYRVLHITLPFPFCKSYLFLLASAWVWQSQNTSLRLQRPNNVLFYPIHSSSRLARATWADGRIEMRTQYANWHLSRQSVTRLAADKQHFPETKSANYYARPCNGLIIMFLYG